MSETAEALVVRPLAVARTYDELRCAIRQRVAEVKASHLDIDHTAGLADGHTGKILCAKHLKLFGPLSTGLLLQTLGLRLILEEDPDNDRWRERLDAKMLQRKRAK